MKILQVTPEFYPSTGYGGGPIVAYEISRMLVQRGHDVTVYTTDANDKTSRLNNGIKNIDNIKVYYFKNISNSMAYKLKLFVSPRMIRIISREINNFDLIHVHDYRTFQNILVHHYAIKHGIPYVLQAHGSISPSFYQKQRQKKIFDEIFGYAILRDVSKVIALTSIEALQYKKMSVNRNKIEIIPNGINLSEYSTLPEKGEFRRKYSIGADEKIILYLGRLHKIKGLDLLVNAFADLAKELDNVRLVMVGLDDGFLSTIKKQVKDFKIAEKVLFTGPLFERDKLMAYVDADVYVLPSVYEIFSVTVLEACACGTPVVVTDRCGIADVIDGKAGFATPYNKDQVRDMIVEILGDEELRLRFGEGGRKLTRKYFSWDTIVGRIEGLYMGCIKGAEKCENR